MMDTASDRLTQAASARREDRLADAHRLYGEAVEAARGGRGEGDGAVLIQALTGLAQIERDFGRCEAALPLYEEALAISRLEGDALTIAHTVRHVGDLHREAGRPEPAERCYLEALEIYRGSTTVPALDLANAIRPLAILRDDAGDRVEARRLWNEARALYAASGVREAVEECSRRLARLDSGL
ncbi:MAG: tetratricopeptide repeat protein [Acidobacteriota bacterium]|nr:tetratricopeptide repeat protein [Acidobacteriota bacterium]